MQIPQLYKKPWNSYFVSSTTFPEEGGPDLHNLSDNISLYHVVFHDKSSVETYYTVTDFIGKP